MPAEPIPFQRRKSARACSRQRSPHHVAHRRSELRRRFRLGHRRRAAQHRRCRAWQQFPASQGSPAQSRAGLRSWRRLHEVLLPGRTRGDRSLRAGGGRLHPERRDQGSRLLGGAGYRSQYRPAHHDLRVDRSARAQSAGGDGRRNLRHLRRHSCHGRQSDRGHGTGRLSRLELALQGRAARSSTCPDARCSPTTSWRPCSTCCSRRPDWRP